MRYFALACDYDGTLARHGRVNDATLEALRRVRESGRRLVLVTGRILSDLARVFPYMDLFDRVVAENGGVLYRPATREEHPLAEAPPAAFIHALRQGGVEPMEAGRVIVATWEPHETVAFELIHRLGLELQVIFNKGAVMILPSGVNKASGLAAALRELSLSPHNAVAVGDAENDHAMLHQCECGVAVANALPAIKAEVDWVTSGDHGEGVVGLIEALLATDLVELAPRLARHHVPLGVDQRGTTLGVSPYGQNLLLAGTSGSGKSTLASGFVEQLAERGYQFCIIDPEGDYQNLEDVVVFGGAAQPPIREEILRYLKAPGQSCVINLLGLSLEARPLYFESLLPDILELRARTGRPHWIVIDESHHLLPKGRNNAHALLMREIQALLLITVHPDHVDPTVLAAMDAVIAIGAAPEETLAAYAAALPTLPPLLPASRLAPGEAILWRQRPAAAPVWFRSVEPRTARLRHVRKYATGALGPDISFYFRGPAHRLNLRAQNLFIFLQMAEGIDDDSWLYHLHRGDYSRWFREAIKDEALADEAATIEMQRDLSPKESRGYMRRAVERRYTVPA